MSWGGHDDLARGLAALRAAVLEAVRADRPALAGMLLSGTAAPPGPDLPSGSGGYGDAGLAASSEDSEAEQTRLIALVELARAGDKDAFGLLYDHYASSVHRFLYYRTRSQTLAEDLTSETFFRALRSMSSFRWQGKDFGAWLMTIARNLATDHFKAGRTRLELTTDDMGQHDDATEGPGVRGAREPGQRGAADRAHRAARRAAGLPDHALPAGDEHRRDGGRPGSFGRRDQAAPAPRRPQPGQARARRVARLMTTHPLDPANRTARPP